jgi:membrane-bound hydrogenase subunit beta
MANEEKIASDLVARFGQLRDKIKIQRARRIWVEAEESIFAELVDHLKNKMGFSVLCTITGLDEGDHLTLIYHIAHFDGTVLSLKRFAPRADPVVTTVTDHFPGGELYEREVMDLLGFVVEGLPPGNRYPLPDSFPVDEHPLRKDWHPKGEKPEGTDARQGSAPVPEKEQ